MAILQKLDLAYVWIPVFGAYTWCGTLLSMIVTWAATGKPHYVSMIGGTIPYISNIGAEVLKPLFIASCSITGGLFFLSVTIKRRLRYNGRLIPDVCRSDRAFATLEISGSFIGCIALILLAIFDTKHYRNVHNVFILVAFVSFGLSLLSAVVEALNDTVRLHRTYNAKDLIPSSLILFTIAFTICKFIGIRATDIAAVLEWMMGFVFALYLYTFHYDLSMLGREKALHVGYEAI